MCVCEKSSCGQRRTGLGLLCRALQYIKQQMDEGRRGGSVLSCSTEQINTVTLLIVILLFKELDHVINFSAVFTVLGCDD